MRPAVAARSAGIADRVAVTGRRRHGGTVGGARGSAAPVRRRGRHASRPPPSTPCRATRRARRAAHPGRSAQRLGAPAATGRPRAPTAGRDRRASHDASPSRPLRRRPAGPPVDPAGACRHGAPPDVDPAIRPRARPDARPVPASLPSAAPTRRRVGRSTYRRRAADAAGAPARSARSSDAVDVAAGGGRVERRRRRRAPTSASVAATVAAEVSSEAVAIEVGGRRRCADRGRRSDAGTPGRGCRSRSPTVVRPSSPPSAADPRRRDRWLRSGACLRRRA